MLDSIRQMGVDYYNALPNNIPRTIGWSIGGSAAASFMVSVLFAKRIDSTTFIIDLGRPLFAASVAGTASIIHALAAPLFKKLAGPDDGAWYVESAKSCVAAFISSIIFGSFVPEAYPQGFVMKSIPLSSNLMRAFFKDHFQSIDNSEYILF